MIKVIFDNENKPKNKKAQFTEICMIIGAAYVLSKVIIRHELELSNLKKTIEEIRSEGV